MGLCSADSTTRTRPTNSFNSYQGKGKRPAGKPYPRYFRTSRSAAWPKYSRPDLRPTELSVIYTISFSPATGRKGAVLSEQVETAYTGPLDPQYNSGIQNSLHTGPATYSTDPLCIQTGGGQGHCRGNTEKGSHSKVQNPRRLYKQHFLGA